MSYTDALVASGAANGVDQMVTYNYNAVPQPGMVESLLFTQMYAGEGPTVTVGDTIGSQTSNLTVSSYSEILTNYCGFSDQIDTDVNFNINSIMPDAAGGMKDLSKALYYNKVWGVDTSVKNGKIILSGSKNAKLDYFRSAGTRMNKSTFFGNNGSYGFGNSLALGLGVAVLQNSYDSIYNDASVEESVVNMTFSAGGAALSAGGGFAAYGIAASVGFSNPVSLGIGAVGAIGISILYPELTEPYRNAATQQLNYTLNEMTKGEYNGKTSSWQKINHYKGFMVNPLRYMGVYF